MERGRLLDITGGRGDGMVEGIQREGFQEFQESGVGPETGGVVAGFFGEFLEIKKSDYI